jgi:hypothetical protein
MSIDNFIIAVFCLIDDELKKVLNGKRLRQRGPAPGLGGLLNFHVQFSVRKTAHRVK